MSGLWGGLAGLVDACRKIPPRASCSLGASATECRMRAEKSDTERVSKPPFREPSPPR